MNISLACVQLHQTIPAGWASVTLAACIAEEADLVLDLQSYLQAVNRLVGLLKEDDVEKTEY